MQTQHMLYKVMRNIFKMEVKYRYTIIIDGEEFDKITVSSFEELIKCMKILKKWEDKYISEKLKNKSKGNSKDYEKFL